MARRMKVYGIAIILPLTYPVSESGNGSRQRMVAGAFPSRKSFHAALVAAGWRNVSMHYLSVYGYSDMGGEALAVLDRPGVLFYNPEDRYGSGYVPLDPA